MNRETIDKAVSELANSAYPEQAYADSHIQAMKVGYIHGLRRGIQWLGEFLCHKPFDEIVKELIHFTQDGNKEDRVGR